MMYLLQQVVTRKYINIFGKINAEYICTFNCAKKTHFKVEWSLVTSHNQSITMLIVRLDGSSTMSFGQKIRLPVLLGIRPHPINSDSLRFRSRVRNYSSVLPQLACR